MANHIFLCNFSADRVPYGHISISNIYLIAAGHISGRKAIKQ
jgi:hypothetical protein